MASRKEQKEQARQARLAAEQALAHRKALQRRYGFFGGVIAIAVIVVVVAIVISTSGGNKDKATGIQTGTTASATYKTVASELAGIPQSGTTLGNPNAKVTIQYFGDLECPICKEFTLGQDDSGLPQLISGPVKSGQVKLVYRSMETASAAVNNAWFVPQQVAAYAAGKQDKFWDYAELFYHEQGDEDSKYVNNSYLLGLAKQIPGLNIAKWQQDRNDASLKAQVEADGKAATKDGLQGTPTLVAYGPSKAEIVPASSGIPTFSEIQSAIKAVS